MGIAILVSVFLAIVVIIMAFLVTGRPVFMVTAQLMVFLGLRLLVKAFMARAVFMVFMVGQVPQRVFMDKRHFWAVLVFRARALVWAGNFQLMLAPVITLNCRREIIPVKDCIYLPKQNLFRVLFLLVVVQFH